MCAARRKRARRVCTLCEMVAVTAGSRTGVCRQCYYSIRRKLGRTTLTREEIAEYVGTRQSEDWSDTLASLEEIGDPARLWNKPPELLVGDCAIVSDLHVPRHDPLLLLRLCRIARRDGIRTLVVAGDLIDFEEISRHRRPEAKGVSAVQSIVAGIQTLDALATQFTAIHVIKGNHDDRAQRLIEAAVQGRDAFARILAEWEGDELEALAYRDRYVAVMERWTQRVAPALRKQVRWYAVPQILVAGPQGLEPYRIVHPSIYSRLAPQAERRLWARYVQPIIGTHGHLWGMSISPSGEHPVLQIGCATRPELHYYLSERLTDHPRWVSGFATIRRGVVKCYVDNPYLVNWEVELDGA